MKVRCDFAVVSSKKTKTCSTHGRALVEWEMSRATTAVLLPRIKTGLKDLRKKDIYVGIY